MTEPNMDISIECTDREPGSLVSEGEVQGRVVWAWEGTDGKADLAGEAEAASIGEALSTTPFKPKPGKVQEVHVKGIEGALFVAGLGKKDEMDRDRLLKAAGAVQKKAGTAGTRGLGVPLPGCLDAQEEARALTEGMSLSSYLFTAYLADEKAREKRASTVSRVLLATGADKEAAGKGVERGAITARAIATARDLVNTPSMDKKPEQLAARALEMAGGGVEVEIWEEEKIRSEGMGAFLGVAAGSEAPPRLIHFTWKPAGNPRRRVAFVGKGVTFDSGGLSLKPAAAMEDMKCDMGGAAAVFGVFSVISELAPPVEVHGVVAATENMPSGTAIRPGDILTAMTGKTIEVLNTDAEGRLTLADALAFACRQGVEEIVDLATLTGACWIALGAASGLFGRPDEYRDRILDAANLSGDRTWPMPMVDDYSEGLESKVADIKNVAGRGGGAITAALFLREFVEDGVDWCHLDIAGSAFAEKEHPNGPAGATGAGTGTLIRHLESFMEE